MHKMSLFHSDFSIFCIRELLCTYNVHITINLSQNCYMNHLACIYIYQRSVIKIYNAWMRKNCYKICYNINYIQTSSEQNRSSSNKDL